jgi:hypothetical protein
MDELQSGWHTEELAAAELEATAISGLVVDGGPRGGTVGGGEAGRLEVSYQDQANPPRCPGFAR